MDQLLSQVNHNGLAVLGLAALSHLKVVVIHLKVKWGKDESEG